MHDLSTFSVALYPPGLKQYGIATYIDDEQDPRAMILDVRWSPDDSRLALATGSYQGVVLHSETGQTTDRLYGHTSSPKIIRWHPGRSNILLTGGRDGTIRLWEIRRSTREIHSPAITILHAHSSTSRRHSITDLVYENELQFYSSCSVNEY